MSQDVGSGHERMRSEELREALSHWDIGSISSIQALQAGSRRAPKVIVEATDGRFMLKRLAKARVNPDRLAFQHRLHRSLQGAGYPVPELMLVRSNAGSLLELKGERYELCRFIEGRRYDGSPADATSSGSRMAGFHDLADRYADTAPPGGGFHARQDVARAAAALHVTRPELNRSMCDVLHAAIKTATRNVAPDWVQLPTTVTHGDWHPGNMLFGAWGVSAVFDLETVRVEPRVAELANGLLHFSMSTGGAGDPAQVSATEMDIDVMQAMIKGYTLVTRTPLQAVEAKVLPWLMLEALLVEGTIVLHRKGRFGSWSGEVFLQFVCDRAEVIRQSVDTITELHGP